MPFDTRRKDANWRLNPNTQTGVVTTAEAQLAVLMDLRDELKWLNDLLHCSNFVGIPQTLRMIQQHTKPKPKPKKKPIRTAVRRPLKP